MSYIVGNSLIQRMLADDIAMQQDFPDCKKAIDITMATLENRDIQCFHLGSFLDVILHNFRGMQDNTEEKPLLGKHVGSWWWSPTLRGSEDVGRVEKVYKLEK